MSNKQSKLFQERDLSTLQFKLEAYENEISLLKAEKGDQSREQQKEIESKLAQKDKQIEMLNKILKELQQVSTKNYAKENFIAQN